MVSISLCLILLEVYFKVPLESLKLDKKLASYGQNTKTGRNWKNRTGCTDTCLTCTGTCWPKMTRTQDVLVHVQGVPVHVTRKCPKCVFFSHFFIFLIPNSTLYFKHTSKPFHMSLVTSFLLNSSFNTYLLSTIYHELLSNPLLYGS